MSKRNKSVKKPQPQKLGYRGMPYGVVNGQRMYTINVSEQLLVIVTRCVEDPSFREKLLQLL